MIPFAAAHIGTYALSGQRYRTRICGSSRVSRTPNLSAQLAVEGSDEGGDSFGNLDGVLCLRIVTGSLDQQHVAAEDLA